jgi:ABC-type multidrug transport system fused ATPase/permease subunit
MEALKSPKATLATVKKVISLSSGSRWTFPFLVFLGFAAAFADSIGTGLIILFLYSVMGRTAEIFAPGSVVGSVLNSVISTTGSSKILLFSIFVLILARIGLIYSYNMITASVRYRLSETVRNRLSEQFLGVSYDFILRHDQGKLLNTWTYESWLIGDMYLSLGRVLINSCAAIIFIGFLAKISWQLLLVGGSGICLLALAMHFLSKPARNMGRRARKEHEKIAKRMLVMLQGMRAVRVFAQERQYHRRFEAASAKVRQISISYERLQALVSPAVQTGYLFVLGAIVLASNFWNISFVATLAFVALLYRLQPCMRDLETNLLNIAQLEASAASVISMLDRSDKVYLPSGTASFGGLRQEIRFEAVCFAYADAPSPCLDQISFTIPAGSVTALVGMSGAGKTTIANLLLRLYQPVSGAILIDGVPLDGLSRESWLSKIAAAGQDMELIEGTVGDNLRVACPEATPAEIRKAAETAHILDTIECLPDGFDTWIGQHGLQLSGGQRQRLGLALALLRDPDILILDEATNALNGGLEETVLNAVRRELAGRTLLIITHRLESALSADQVICIGASSVLEWGSPAELWARPSSFLRTLLETGDGVEAPHPVHAAIKAEAGGVTPSTTH